MKGFAALVAGAFIAAVLGPAALAKGPFGSIQVGEWKGGAYTDDNTGAFTHCAAGGEYRNGVYLVISKLVDNSWSLGFASKSFSFVIGETFPIDVTFDGQSQLRLFGTALSPELVGAILPGNGLSKLRKSHLMVAQTKGTTYQFQLADTARLVATIEYCLVTTKSAGTTNVGKFIVPVTAATKEAPTTSAPVASNSKSSSGENKTVTQTGDRPPPSGPG